MNQSQIRERIAELEAEALDLKAQIRNDEPNIEDFKVAIETHPKRERQRNNEETLGEVIDEIAELKDELDQGA